MFKRIAVLCLCIALCPNLLRAQKTILRIAAAADLQPVLPKFIAEFESQNGIRVEASYASSATLATQILNGAPYDLFLAANRGFPQKIVDARLAVESTPVTYARGILVLWVRNNLLSGPITMQSLKDPRIHRIAVANPVHAPYGTAAMAALASLGLTAALRPKLVFAENIAQTAQFGQSGNAECALISKTIAIAYTMRQAGTFVLVPTDSYPALEQSAVILKNAAHPQQASYFLAYMQSAAGRELLNASGLDAPTLTR